MFVKKEIDILGSRNALNEDFHAVISYLRRGACPIDSIITRIVSPEDIKSAFSHWSEDIKALVEF
jgi:threonine dehydrogenase-like Zn-dependent dehydrogenase